MSHLYKHYRENMKKTVIGGPLFGGIVLICIVCQMNLGRVKVMAANKSESVINENSTSSDAVCDISYITDNEKKDVQVVEHKLDQEKEVQTLENKASEKKVTQAEEKKTDGTDKILNTQSSESGEDQNTLAVSQEPVNYKNFFNDTIFLGDSLTEFLSAAEMLPERNVMAEKGNNVSKALKNDIDKLKYENPKRIMILFGTNDVVYFSNSSLYKEKYLTLIQEIKKVLPDTMIYIESPTPIRSNAQRQGTNFNNETIGKFRKATEEAASETGSEYIDITTLIKDDEYFEVDGIHFKHSFYDALLDLLTKEIQDREKK